MHKLGRANRYPQVNVVEPSETRICFPFLNSGSCKFGDTCKYRHLAQDHPDAIADKERQMNRRNAQTVPTSNQVTFHSSTHHTTRCSHKCFARVSWVGKTRKTPDLSAFPFSTKGVVIRITAGSATSPPITQMQLPMLCDKADTTRSLPT